MAFIEWSDALSVHVPVIDNEHRQLIGIINSLYNAIENKKEDITTEETMEQLMGYIRTHFVTEERLMSQYQYPDRSGLSGS